MSTSLDQIPDRLFVSDPDYDPEFGRRLRVMLDGVEQKAVIGFDFSRAPDVGVVTRYKTDAEGNYVIDEVSECVMVEDVQGDLIVTLFPR